MSSSTLYDTVEGVEAYVAMADGFDGWNHIERLHQLLPSGAAVLELGMGPGVDLERLAERYEVVGSDSSQVFLDRYAHRRPETELLLLDAVTIETTRSFDCIYSNKVLHHLTTDELTRSLRRQAELIGPDGLLLHGLWAGTSTENYEGLHSQQYTANTLAAAMPDSLVIAECTSYQEMTAGDSIQVILRPITSPSARG